MMDPILFVNILVTYNYINGNINFICNSFLMTHINQYKSLEMAFSEFYGFIFVYFFF